MKDVFFCYTNFEGEQGKDKHQHHRKEKAIELSFPNQIRGKIASIESDKTLTVIHVDTPMGMIASGIITPAAQRLNLQIGDEVIAVFRALDVSLVKL